MSLFICHSSFVTHHLYSPLICHHSPFTILHSPFLHVTHSPRHSPLTIHHSPFCIHHFCMSLTHHVTHHSPCHSPFCISQTSSLRFQIFKFSEFQIFKFSNFQIFKLFIHYSLPPDDMCIPSFNLSCSVNGAGRHARHTARHVAWGEGGGSVDVRGSLGVRSSECDAVHWMSIHLCECCSECSKLERIPLADGGGPHTTYEGREIRTPNLLIWNQTRCRCATSPYARSVRS